MGSTQLLLTVDTIDIATRVSLDALVSHLEEVFALAERQGFLWTNLNAGRRLAILQSGVITEDTFLDDRCEGTGILESGDIKRASDDAVSATDTDAAIIDNSTFFGLGVGVDKTGTEASWLGTMITLHFAVDRVVSFRVVAINNGVGTFIGAPLLRAVMEGLVKNRHIIKRLVGVRQLLFLVAAA